MIEVREVLRGWLGGAGLRTVAAQAGVDRKTARRYVQAAEAAGVLRDGGWGQVTDGVVGEVVAAVRPARPAGHGSAWEQLQVEQRQIADWVGKGLTVVKIGALLSRRGVVVPYRTLHRFCVQCCGFGRTTETVRVADGEPGAECQVDFGRMGLLYDPAAGRRRTAHALIFTAVYSRHMFVWLTFAQTLEAVIAGMATTSNDNAGQQHQLPGMLGQDQILLPICSPCIEQQANSPLPQIRGNGPTTC